MPTTRSVRRARVAVALTFATHGAVSGTIAARIPSIQDRLHLSAGVLGLALVMPAAGGVGSMLLAGRVVHRLGSGRATRLLLPLWALALLLPALAPNVAVLCVGFVAYGASAGLADVAMNAQGVAIERVYRRSIMSGLHGMWSVGSLVASGIGAFAAHRGITVRTHLVVAALAIAVVAVIVTLPLLGDEPDDAGADAPRLAWPTGAVLLIGLVAFCAIFAEGSGADWAAVFLRHVAHADPGVAAAAYTTFATAMAAGRLGGDAVVARLGPVTTVRCSGVLGTAGALLVSTAASTVQAFIGFGLLGLGIAVVVPLAFAAAGHAGAHPGHAIAGVATISYGAGMGAPGAIGAIADASSLRVSFVLVAVLVSLTVVGARALRAAGTVGSPPPILTKSTQ